MAPTVHARGLVWSWRKVGWWGQHVGLRGKGCALGEVLADQMLLVEEDEPQLVD